MRLLFLLDKGDFDPAGRCFQRDSARCILLRDGLVAMVYSEAFDYYKFPGGGIEAGESREEALLREAAEEAGLRIRPESIREYGCVRRMEKSSRADVEWFLQDNFYYLCQAEAELQPQQLTEKEAKARYVLRFVPPEIAIRTNRGGIRSPKQRQELEREARVLECLLREGYFEPQAANAAAEGSRV